MKKKVILVFILVFSLCGCSTTLEDTSSVHPSSESVTDATSTDISKNVSDEFFDDKAIETIGEALEKRWKLIDEEEQKSDYTESELKQEYLNYINTELGVLNKYSFENENYKDEKLKEYVISYVDCIKRSKETIDLLDNDKLDWSIIWLEIYIERCNIIIELNKNYGLTVDDKYSHNFDEMPESVSDSVKDLENEKKLKEIVSNVKYTVDDTKYDGYYNYEAIIDNDSDFDIRFLELSITLLDENDINVNTYYSNISNLNAHEKGKMSDFSDENNYTNMRIQVNSFTID